MKCEKCGQENLEGSTFCKSCGNKFIEKEEQDNNTEINENIETAAKIINSNNVKKYKDRSNNVKIALLIVINIFLGITLLCLFFWPSIKCSISQEWKPIIYVYPQEEMKVTVVASNPEKFTVTYPKYQNNWEVTAMPDGTLTDKDGKKYYALYWEGINTTKNKVKEDGFIVEGKNVAFFLEKKLKVLGLNYKEANEFIMYWLPKLEQNKYNYIRFQTMEEINENMNLEITPKPETLIRVRMEYKPLNKKITVKEQKLEKRERKGYTVVEWGVTEIIN